MYARLLDITHPIILWVHLCSKDNLWFQDRESTTKTWHRWKPGRTYRLRKVLQAQASYDWTWWVYTKTAKYQSARYWFRHPSCEQLVLTGCCCGRLRKEKRLRRNFRSFVRYMWPWDTLDNFTDNEFTGFWCLGYTQRRINTEEYIFWRHRWWQLKQMNHVVKQFATVWNTRQHVATTVHV